MITYLLLIIGFFLLIKGSGWLVDGAADLARRYKIKEIVVGLTIVAFGTSAPELIVNVLSAIRGNTDIALGNIIGSNFSNTLLILGLAVMIYPMKLAKSTTWREIPFNIFAVLLLFLLANNLFINNNRILSQFDGLILLACFAMFMVYMFKVMKEDKQEAKHDVKKSNSTLALMIIGGCIALFLGGKFVVDSAVEIARNFGLSEFLISATIIAIGTSLPELITSVVAALKKSPSIAVGNIIGSNVFNILLVLGVTGVINPVPIAAAMNVDLIWLIIATLLLFLFMFTGKRQKLDRWEGAVLFLMYIAYVGFIIWRG